MTFTLKFVNEYSYIHVHSLDLGFRDGHSRMCKFTNIHFTYTSSEFFKPNSSSRVHHEDRSVKKTNNMEIWALRRPKINHLSSASSKYANFWQKRELSALKIAYLSSIFENMVQLYTLKKFCSSVREQVNECEYSLHIRFTWFGLSSRSFVNM